MKKIIILLIGVLFLTSGCYDYTELNELAIISAISIDYKEENYEVALEILNSKNKNDTTEKKKVYIAKGKGKNISEAVYSSSLELAKTPYLAHLKAVIIDEEIACNHLKEIVDYLLRDNYIRNIFYVVVAKDEKAVDILENSDTNNPIVGTAIKSLIENTTYVNNISANANYEKLVVDIIEPRKDAYVSSIEIKNGVLKLGPIAIFDGYKMKHYLTIKESETLNLINGTSREAYFKIDCPGDKDNFIALTSYNKPKSGIDFSKDTATLSLKLEMKITENHCKVNFKDKDAYQKLQKYLNKEIQKDMKNLVEVLIQNKSDTLKIENSYYQKYKKDIDFTKLHYKYKVDSLINRNGLIFEVKK